MDSSQSLNEHFRQRVISGDPQALFIMGSKNYARGSFEDAMKFWRDAAKKGHAGAMNNLGVLYQNGDGVEPDVAQSFKWIRKAAIHGGVPETQGNLGELYARGVGVKRDYEEAAEWLLAAANKNVAQAQVLLGELCEMGRGVPQDIDEARRWYEKAAARGHEKAQAKLLPGGIDPAATAREWDANELHPTSAQSEYGLWMQPQTAPGRAASESFRDAVGGERIRHAVPASAPTK